MIIINATNSDTSMTSSITAAAAAAVAVQQTNVAAAAAQSNSFGGQHFLLFALLILINLIVIFGNILVIVAVYASAKLRNVTNIFIVSLATADLLLGLLVLPYALMYEVSFFCALNVLLSLNVTTEEQRKMN